MPSVPGMKGHKEGLSRKEAQALVKSKKADGYKAFLESYAKNKYRVVWY